RAGVRTRTEGGHASLERKTATGQPDVTTRPVEGASQAGVEEWERGPKRGGDREIGRGGDEAEQVSFSLSPCLPLAGRYFFGGGSFFSYHRTTTVGASGAFPPTGITSSLVSSIFLTFFWPSRNSSGPTRSSNPGTP